jgi:hypothetical protein
MNDFIVTHINDKNNVQEEDEKRNYRSKIPTALIAGFIIIIILIMGLIATVYSTLTQTYFIQKASGGSTNKVVLENSYLFASPLQAAAGGNEKIRITIFLLDSQGKGVMDKTVVLQADENLDVASVGSTTNELGEAIFDISSIKKGTYVIQAKVDQTSVPQKVSVVFN